MASNDSTVLGVVILARHGDRQGFYQDPDTYDASLTVITPLGNQQEFQLGTKIRSLYLNSSSPLFINGISDTLVNQTEIEVLADNDAGEGGVILDSAMSMLQGLFPASVNYTTTLANGSTITGPLNGYQYVPVESVVIDLDVSLEGWTDCNTFNDATTAFYNSTAFQQKATESATFLNQLPQYLDGRPVTLENMWNIFDFMNVNSIHNKQFFDALPPTFLAQARDLANWHEYGVFTSPQLTGIGNIAGQTILPSILDGFARISDPSDPLKIVYEALAYKPFLSLFNMTGVAQANPELAGIVNYAAAVAIEVRQPTSGGPPVLRFNFKNGTDDDDFKTYNFMGTTGDVPLSTFVNTLGPVVVNDTATWCTVCNNDVDRGCGALALAASQARSEFHQRISPVGAGFLGAGLTLAVLGAAFGVLAFLGFLSVGRAKSKRRGRGDGSDSETSVERKD